MISKDVMKKKGVTQSKKIVPILKIATPSNGVQAFKSSKLPEEIDIVKIADLLARYKESMKLFQERISETYKTPISYADIYGKHFEVVKNLQEQLLVSSLTISEALKPVLDSSKVFESLALSQASIADQLKGLVINLPLKGYSNTLGASTSFELTLDKFTSIKSHPNDYLLTGTASQKAQHERLGLKLSTGFEMRITSIETKIDANNEKLDYLIEKDERRDSLMEELVSYVKSTGNQLAKVLNIEYNQSNTEITIGNIVVKLRGNTNQSDICNVLLSSQEAMQRKWEMEDIQEAMGEIIVEHKNWRRTIYDALKEVNIKILIESKGSVSDFFLLTMKTVTVNPCYIA